VTPADRLGHGGFGAAGRIGDGRQRRKENQHDRRDGASYLLVQLLIGGSIREITVPR
jgi:hypothetical protein